MFLSRKVKFAYKRLRCKTWQIFMFFLLLTSFFESQVLFNVKHRFKNMGSFLKNRDFQDFFFFMFMFAKADGNNPENKLHVNKHQCRQNQYQVSFPNF